jgi:hypothetical protein
MKLGVGSERYGKRIWIKMARVSGGSRLERMAREGDIKRGTTSQCGGNVKHKSSLDHTARRTRGYLVPFPLLRVDRAVFPHNSSVNNTGS